jgi:glucose-6-phosphate 1-dehydrogenase
MIDGKECGSVTKGGFRCCQPCACVIFGATGDLTQRKLIPALYNLAVGGNLPDHFAIVGTGRHAGDPEEFKAKLRKALDEFVPGEVDETKWKWLSDRLYFFAGEYSDKATFDRLSTLLDEVEVKHKTGGNCLFYLATPPELFASISVCLHETNLMKETATRWRRLIIEKPFGRDLATAKSLNAKLGDIFKESQIYRIDHYLGKETVQNILVFRFGNGIFEPVWNHRYIDHVQISALETVGVEKRATYFETAGAMRDMIPNHVLQLLALIAMEPPISLQSEAIRNEKARVLSSLQPFDEEAVRTRVVRGQYGQSIDPAKPMEAYRAEPGVNPESSTETFVAMKLMVDNWRWSGVPFYLRTGKRLAKRLTEIVIQFKRPPLLLFPEHAAGTISPNMLVIRIQPDEGISLRFGAKIPGPSVKLGSVDMAFDYGDYFGATPNTGYETLLYDAICGDQTLFQRSDGIELGWKAMEPVLRYLQHTPSEGFPNYASGSWGPVESDALLARDGRKWRQA